MPIQVRSRKGGRHAVRVSQALQAPHAASHAVRTAAPSPRRPGAQAGGAEAVQAPRAGRGSAALSARAVRVRRVARAHRSDRHRPPVGHVADGELVARQPAVGDPRGHERRPRLSAMARRRAGTSAKARKRSTSSRRPRARSASRTRSRASRSSGQPSSASSASPCSASRTRKGRRSSSPDYDPPAPPPLREVADRLGVDVTYAPHVGDARGYYSPRDDRIVLLSHDQRVFFHELAHAAHQRVLQARGETLKGGQHPARRSSPRRSLRPSAAVRPRTATSGTRPST